MPVPDRPELITPNDPLSIRVVALGTGSGGVEFAMTTSPSFTEMRRRNASDILSIVRREPGISRSDVARMANLSKATVSSIIDDLIQLEVLYESGLKSSERGRPAVGLGFNARSGYALGISLEDARVDLTLCDLSGNLCYEAKFLTKEKTTASAVHVWIRECVELWFAGLKRKPGKLRSIGLGAPAPVLTQDVQGSRWMHSGGWGFATIADLLNEEFQVPLVVDSNINMVALAEMTIAPAHPGELMAVVRLGHQVRSALAIGNSLLSGHCRLGGDLGHIAVPGNFAVCSCGLTGCINTVASADALITSVANHGLKVSSADEVINLARSGDAAALKALSDAGHAVGYGVAVLMNVLAPRQVIISGPFLSAGKLLLEPIRQAAVKYAYGLSAERCDIFASSASFQAESMGAALRALSNYELLSSS